MLGIDLIRVQTRSIESVNELKVNLFENKESLKFSTECLKESSSKLGRWISEDEYWDFHVEDEVSYNVREMRSQSKELGENIEAVTLSIDSLVEALERNAINVDQVANATLVVSKIGLALIFIGFVLQLCGAAGAEIYFKLF